MSAPIETTRDSLLSLYQQVLGRTIDAKTLSYWTNMIHKGEKTMEDYEAALIIGEADYTERLRQMFTNAFREVVGYDFDFPKQDFRTFLKRDACNRVPSHQDIVQWIKTNSADFNTKYVNIIQVTYNIHTDSDCTPDIIDFYMDKLRTAEDYNLMSLELDIKSRAHDACVVTVDITAEEAKSLFVRKSWKDDLLENAPLSDMLKEKLSYATDAEAVSILEQVVNPMVVLPTLKGNELDEFETVFGRPMYVKEYFKYVVEAPEPLPQEKLKTIRDKQTRDYNVMHGLYRNYNNIDLTEWSFVHKHLYDVDAPEFFDTFVDGIVFSDAYKKSMVDVLNFSNKQLYDTHLDESDIEYVFKKVQDKRLGLNDDSVIEVLKDLKYETDLFVENISDTYKKTLERHPDVYEISKYVEMYRHDVPALTIEKVNENLSKILVNELEFHDIIKKHIGSVYSSKKGGAEILRSKLFDILNKILQKLHDITIYNLDEVIARYIE